MLDINTVMKDQRSLLYEVAHLEQIYTTAMSCQLALMNGQPEALRVLLAAIYLAGKMDAVDIPPDPDIWGDIQIDPL